MTIGSDGKLVCGLPPAGWQCSRDPGHEGLCAARRDPSLAEKTIVHKFEHDCIHEMQPAFYLSKKQVEAAQVWMQQHDQDRHILEGKTHRYSGAIGGDYTWNFTSTSIGLVVTVTCACGETYDVSDYDNLW